VTDTRGTLPAPNVLAPSYLGRGMFQWHLVVFGTGYVSVASRRIWDGVCFSGISSYLGRGMFQWHPVFGTGYVSVASRRIWDGVCFSGIPCHIRCTSPLPCPSLLLVPFRNLLALKISSLPELDSTRESVNSLGRRL